MCALSSQEFGGLTSRPWIRSDIRVLYLFWVSHSRSCLPLVPSHSFIHTRRSFLMCTTSQPKGRSCSRSSHFLTVLLPVVMFICTTYLLKWRSSPLDTRWSTHHDPLQRRQLEQFYTTSSTTSFVSSGSGSPTTTATTPSLSSTPPLSSTSQTTSMSEQLIPTMPNGPPILPTPFPQAFDGGVAQNFSTMGCASFFANMTSSAPFRTCRPFSLLLGTSAAFINVRCLCYDLTQNALTQFIFLLYLFTGSDESYPVKLRYLGNV